MYIYFILIGLVIIVVGIYNKLIRAKNHVDEASADINVQLKRRFDLIPNLVETVKGYVSHEKEVLEKITQLRSQALATSDFKESDKINQEISKNISNILVSFENYPELKANQNFLALQTELVDTENKIQASRRFYNNVAKDYNILIESIPTNIFAKLFNYQRRLLLEISAEEAKNVTVKF
ncbi:MAG TPA: LemA family protein [Candidatus Paceibacterota bacterium]|nr:LemA family protein [Candidatus Paceibacterota bacterium]HRZ29579.1 LemA family protein [Candidatus Paceibacterota bacterium]